MSPLRGALADYLSVRRALGFKLDRAEKLIGQFLDYLEDRQTTAVTTEHALAWATSPADAAPWWWTLRLSAVRPFAAYLHTLDPDAEVPPAGLIAAGAHRATPFLYSGTDITALVDAAAMRTQRLAALNYPALISLLAATGMRVGEALGLTDADFDDDQGVLTVRDAKFGKSRLLPLHPSTTAALRRYRSERDRLHPAGAGPLFVSRAGTHLRYNRVWGTFRQITEQAGIAATSANCRPRIHDIRHSFAVNTLLDWYRHGEDVQALLPRLSTYLGHADPKHTYWYLSAAPELLALAGDRLETYLGETP